MNTITNSRLQAFKENLIINEKSQATVSKYMLALHRLAKFLNGGAITKARLLQFRESLLAAYKAQTVNGFLSAINAYLDFFDLRECRVKFLKVQRRSFLEEEKELTQCEYKRLLTAAETLKKEWLGLLLMTLCSTGIRISELKYITVEAAASGHTEINLKGKCRVIILPKELRRKLLSYAKAKEICRGCVFTTKSGKPMDRSNINHALKTLCGTAKVKPCKVFPHNLRHLFARTFFSIDKNLAHLADVLGHSRIETTRIYVAVSAAEHEKILNHMKLVV